MPSIRVPVMALVVFAAIGANAQVCDGNHDCEPTHYCFFFPEGQCSSGGHCAPRFNGICTAEVDPVCGCDGLFYSNECVASQLGAAVGPDACGVEACCSFGTFCQRPMDSCSRSDLGFCALPPVTCPPGGMAVCGCDGVDYENECFAHAAGVSVAKPGPCRCGGPTGVPCLAGNLCRVPEGQCFQDPLGFCEPIPVSCPSICDPVCGCDGQDYDNACLAELGAGSVDHRGTCGEPPLIEDVRFSGSHMLWDSDPAAFSYNLYRYIRTGANPGNARCFRAGIQVHYSSILGLGEPMPGVVFYFVVTGLFDFVEGPLGFGSDCLPRIPSVSCSP